MLSKCSFILSIIINKGRTTKKKKKVEWGELPSHIHHVRLGRSFSSPARSDKRKFTTITSGTTTQTTSSAQWPLYISYSFFFCYYPCGYDDRKPRNRKYLNNMMNDDESTGHWNPDRKTLKKKTCCNSRIIEFLSESVNHLQLMDVLPANFIYALSNGAISNIW